MSGDTATAGDEASDCGFAATPLYASALPKHEQRLAQYWTGGTAADAARRCPILSSPEKVA
jgi:hypothetical protein